MSEETSKPILINRIRVPSLHYKAAVKATACGIDIEKLFDDPGVLGPLKRAIINGYILYDDPDVHGFDNFDTTIRVLNMSDYGHKTSFRYACIYRPATVVTMMQYSPFRFSLEDVPEIEQLPHSYIDDPFKEILFQCALGRTQPIKYYMMINHVIFTDDSVALIARSAIIYRDQELLELLGDAYDAIARGKTVGEALLYNNVEALEYIYKRGYGKLYVRISCLTSIIDKCELKGICKIFEVPDASLLTPFPKVYERVNIRKDIYNNEYPTLDQVLRNRDVCTLTEMMNKCTTATWFNSPEIENSIRNKHYEMILLLYWNSHKNINPDAAMEACVKANDYKLLAVMIGLSSGDLEIPYNVYQYIATNNYTPILHLMQYRHVTLACSGEVIKSIIRRHNIEEFCAIGPYIYPLSAKTIDFSDLTDEEYDYPIMYFLQTYQFNFTDLERLLQCYTPERRTQLFRHISRKIIDINCNDLVCYAIHYDITTAIVELIEYKKERIAAGQQNEYFNMVEILDVWTGFCVDTHNYNAAKLMIEAGADVHIRDDMLLINAYKDCNTEMVEWLLARGANVNKLSNVVVTRKTIDELQGMIAVINKYKKKTVVAYTLMIIDENNEAQDMNEDK